MKERKEEVYPVKTFHELESKLMDEWRKIKNATVTGLIAAAAVFVFAFRWFLKYLRPLIRKESFDAALLFIVMVCLGYVLYVFYSEYRFQSTWQKRFKKLVEFEEKIMEKRTKENEK